MSSIRITAGTLRGRKVRLPATGLRPTSSRAREAVCNILSSEIPDSRFLDLFAGTGIMSIEAISRGARHATAVESNRKAATNLEKLALDWIVPVTVENRDVLRFLSSSSGLEPFDIVYADPPYDFEAYEEILDLVDQTLPLVKGAVVAIEHRRKRRIDTDSGYVRLEHRESRAWGQISVEFFDVNVSLGSSAKRGTSVGRAMR